VTPVGTSVASQASGQPASDFRKWMKKTSEVLEKGGTP
jgi:hypothetical protein